MVPREATLCRRRKKSPNALVNVLVDRQVNRLCLRFWRRELLKHLARSFLQFLFVFVRLACQSVAPFPAPDQLFAWGIEDISYDQEHSFNTVAILPRTRTGKYTRCRMHGGASTGPRTEDGLERCRKAVWKHGRRSGAAIAARKRLAQARL